MNLERRLAVAFVESHPTQAAMALERMPAAQRQAVLQGLAVPVVARAVERMTTPLASDAISRLSPDEAARLLGALEVEVSAALLRRLAPEASAPIVELVPEPARELLRRVLRYPADSAGALMDPV
ncbi:MAG TPA: hypothetical protein VLD67_13760, partial [Vicinamibacterales bacterium]|nr:hypothetical protein [Vicinamibacterales bacterium]